MGVGREKVDDLQKKLKSLGVREEDLEEKFILGSGPGGQKVNKTASTVYLKHIPSGIEIKSGKERSRELNRFLARRQLCELLEKDLLGSKTKKEKRIEKIRKQKERRSRRRDSKID